MPSKVLPIATKGVFEVKYPISTQAKYTPGVVFSLHTHASWLKSYSLHTQAVWRRERNLRLHTKVFAALDVCMQRHVDAVRKLLNDYAASNPFLQDVQFSDYAIAFHLRMVLQDINTRPPVRAYFTACDMPYPVCWYYGTIASLLKSMGHTDVRNAYPFTAGDVALNPDKSNQYFQVAQYFDQMYEQYLARIKNELNMAAGWGGWWPWDL